MNKKGKGGGVVILLIALLGVGYYFFVYEDGSHNPLNNNNSVPDNTYADCKIARDCQDLYKNCYFGCTSGKCTKISTLVALKPYPDCSSASTGLCTNGQRKCVPSMNQYGKYQVCENGAWSTDKYCSYGYRCEEGSCVMFLS